MSNDYFKPSPNKILVELTEVKGEITRLIVQTTATIKYNPRLLIAFAVM